MWPFGYSLDNLSLMALTIAVGFVVDDAIAMLENITRYVEAGTKKAGRTVRGRFIRPAKLRSNSLSRQLYLLWVKSRYLRCRDHVRFTPESGH
jgi:hypothetical protein